MLYSLVPRHSLWLFLTINWVKSSILQARDGEISLIRSIYLLLWDEFNEKYLKDWLNIINNHWEKDSIQSIYVIYDNQIVYLHIPSLMWSHSAVWQVSILSQVCYIDESFPNPRASPFDVESIVNKRYH